jgi:hypothetical protein
VEILAQKAALAGGLLPKGAVQAVVIDRSGREHEAVTGDHAWLVMLSDSTPGKPPIMRFLDAGGSIVPAPLPAGVELEPVPDADEPCPSCGVADWALVASPGENDHGRRTAMCRHCRHQEELPALLRPAARPYASDTQPEVHISQHRILNLASLHFGPYGLAGHTPTLIGAGGPGEEPDRVTLAFITENGRATVETDTRMSGVSPDQIARQTLEDLLRQRDKVPDDWEQRSNTAYSLWLNGRARARAADVAAVSLGELELPIDGVPTVFATATRGERFTAVARFRDITIKIAGHGIPRGAALETVAPNALRYRS